MKDPEERSGTEPHRIPIGDSIDLHTFAPKDAVSVVADYLEEAVRRGFSEVRIIHGRGTGVQRQAVRAVLSRHPLVVAFADAPPEAGGWGATVVRLRRPGNATSGR
ncbi:MAG: Smr/MutS family protein [Deltaproteobacteria bacterium]